MRPIAVVFCHSSPRICATALVCMCEFFCVAATEFRPACGCSSSCELSYQCSLQKLKRPACKPLDFSLVVICDPIQMLLAAQIIEDNYYAEHLIVLQFHFGANLSFLSQFFLHINAYSASSLYGR